ncbi:MAG: diguanylate cyclase [Cellvibrio sp.]|jgi:diguanylate cyclase (GGDEF)-like protein/PAS domain S-box-containing protein|nr:diguanylate cyclase [Cellvibrio sp.]
MATAAYAPLGKYMDLLLDAVCVVDKDGHFIYVSNSCEQIFGYTQEEMIGKQMLDLVHPDDKHLTLQTVARIIAGEAQPHFENRYLRKNGDTVHIMWSARWSEADQCRVAVARDITRRKHAEAVQMALFAISEASHHTEDLPRLFEQIHLIIGRLLPAQNFSIALYDAVSAKVSFPYHCDQYNPAPIDQRLDEDTPCTQVIRTGQTLLLNADSPELHTSPGNNTPHSWLGIPLKSHSRTTGALVLRSYSDNTCHTEKEMEVLQFVSTQVAAAIDRKQMIARLQYLALYDQLTRLPNRELFYDRINSAIARARRHHGIFSLFYLDLNKFKAVNDVHGHTTGDLLLEQVARRLEHCVRECDTIARFGGDEFVILLENIDHPDQSAIVADKIYFSLSQPFILAEHNVIVLPSIGIAHFPQHGDNEKDLLRHADAAMYRHKNNQ